MAKKDNTEFNEILSSAFEKVEKEFRDGIIGDLGSDTIRRDNLGDYFKKLYNDYNRKEAFATLDPVTGAIDTKERLSVDEIAEARDGAKYAYASVFALKTLFNLCVAKDIKDEIDNHFKNDMENPLRAELNAFVDKKLEMKGDSPASTKLTEVLKEQFETAVKNNEKTGDILSKSYKFIHDFNDYMSIETGLSSKWFKSSDNTNYSTLQEAMLDQIKGYTGELKNHVVCPLEYPTDKDFTPQDFVKHVEKGVELTKSEEVWLENSYMNMCTSIMMNHPQFSYKVSGIDPIEFSIDGNTVHGTSDYDRMKKVMSAVISGKNVTCDLVGYDVPVRVHPEFELLQNEDNRGFWERLFDSIKDILGISDRSKVKKLNQELAKNDDSRYKTSFSELLDTNKVDELKTTIASSKKEATKEIAKDAPTKH